MVAQLIPQQGLSLRLPFRCRREVFALLDHQPATVHHLPQARLETVPLESLRRARRAFAPARLPFAPRPFLRSGSVRAPANASPPLSHTPTLNPLLHTT